MPLHNLRDLTLRISDPGRFIADDDHCIAISDLQNGASIDVGFAYQRSVLLKTTKQLPTVLAALELDGIARRLVFCPPDQWHHLPSIIKTAETELIVCDEIDWTVNVPQMAVQAPSLFFPAITERPVETEWVILTSGTTGIPKCVIHTLGSLSGPLEDGNISPGSKWGTFYDVRRYGGMQMLLRALLGGGSMILSAPETVNDYLLRLARMGVTHLSGTPSQWRQALMSPLLDAIAPEYVRLSGEIADQTILDRLRRMLPTARISHAYASTEAGVAFDVQDGMAGFPADFAVDGADIGICVLNDTLHIRSLRAAKGYIGAPLNTTNGFVDTGDLVCYENGRYYFGGRREGVINVGGQKVHPEEVEAIIVQHPEVKMVRVWGRRSSIIGNVVAADVVLQPDFPLDAIRAEIVENCRQKLARWKVPVMIRRVDAIALSNAGKVSRHE